MTIAALRAGSPLPGGLSGDCFHMSRVPLQLSTSAKMSSRPWRPSRGSDGIPAGRVTTNLESNRNPR